MRFFTVLVLGALTLAAAGDYSNRRAPGFSLADSHYQQHDPQDYRGKVLILDIMLTTCPVCTKLADTLVAVKKKYEDQVGIISIVTLPDNFQSADKFAADHKIQWPVVFDSGQVLMSYLRVTPVNPQVHFPHLFLIDKEGVIRNDFEGTDDQYLSLEGLSKEIGKLLQ